MKKLLLIASALLAFSFFGCEQPSTPDTGKSDAATPADPIVVVDEEGKTLSFTCVINTWGSNGSVQIDLPQSIMLNEGDVYTVSGEVEFGTPSKGNINQFYIQDTIAYDAPLSYNMIFSDTAALADTTKSFSGDWTVEADQAGELKKLQFCLGWRADGAEADATCDVVIKNVKFLKK